MQPGDDVGDGNPDPHRSAAGLASDRHQAAHPLDDLVDARPRLVGAILAEGRDAGIDQPRVDRSQRLISEAEPFLHVGPKILHQHVCLLDHAVENVAAFLAAQVERHATLVAVLVLEVRLVPAGDIARIAGALDADDIGAPIRKLAHAHGPRARVGEIEHDQVLQRTRGGSVEAFELIRSLSCPRRRTSSNHEFWLDARRAVGEFQCHGRVCPGHLDS